MEIKDKIALVDGDLIVYRVGLADKTQEEPLSYTLHSVKTFVESILSNFSRREEAKLFLTGKGNYRDTMATIKPYKGNRDPSKRPVYFDEIREYLTEYHGAVVVQGQEADDAIAQAQWEAKDKSTVICSIDKDLLNGVPGWSFNYIKGVVKYTTLAEANLFLFRQMLEGDTSDNIPGIDKVGPKTVDKLFKGKEHDLEQIKQVVKGLYAKQYGSAWEQAYTEVGNLLWIRRTEGESCPLL